MKDEALELARRIPRLEALVPEQIIDSPGPIETTAALIDQWGRAHHLRELTTIGRDRQATIAVIEGSVSRMHVELSRRGKTGEWLARDLGSTNGTFLEGRRLAAPAPLRDLQLLVAGDVGFVFVLDASTVSAAGATGSIRATRASHRRDRGLRLLEPVAGGGGVAEHDGNEVKLGAAQLALVRLLAERYLAERDRPEEVRGFVRGIEIMASLPWDTAHPDDNHVKQLVRRVRRALARVGLEAAIESRHGFGYRLVVAPIFSSE